MVTEELIDQAQRPGLRDAARSMARSRILEGASIVAARSGLNFTIEEVAAEAGVSRRTVFRHYANHAVLLGAVIRETLISVQELAPADPKPGQDLPAWLVDALTQFHEFIRTYVGRAFWDVYSGGLDLPDDVRGELTKVVAMRQATSRLITKSAWSAVGASGEPPAWVFDAFGLHFSGYATFSFPTYSARETAEISAKVLWAVLITASDSVPAGAEN